MTIWIDAQLSPFIASWINKNFGEITAKSVRSLGLRDANDHAIFKQAKAENAVIMSKDDDFVKLLELHGPPPQLIWITCGNTSNAKMCEILNTALPQTIKLLRSGEPMVEIGG